MNETILFKPIGIIHTLFIRLAEMPIQPGSDTSGKGTIEIFPEFTAGLKDLEGFSHVYILYHLHKVSQVKMQVIPFLDDGEPRGIFATRAPSRPNPIGLSLVEVIEIEGSLIHINRVDTLNGTPLLDIKPYVPQFEPTSSIRIGWLEDVKDQIRSRRSDNRFT